MFSRFNQNTKSKAVNSSRSRFRKPNRTGIATVECAICLTVLVPIIFGTIEMCSGYLVKQSLTVSAYEGVRSGVGRGATNADILTRTAQILEFRDIQLGAASTTEFAQPGAEYGIFLITPNNLPVEDLDALDPITVRIVAPSDVNATPIFKHMLNRKIEASATMVREFDSPIDDVNVIN